MDALRVAKVERVLLEHPSRTPPHTRVHVQGTLHLTPHHLIFRPTALPPAAGAGASEQPAAASAAAAAAAAAAEAAHEVWVPYPTINVLQRLPQAPSGRYPLLVGTKTFDSYTLLFERDREGGAEDVWQSVKDSAVAHNVEQLYAFFYTLPRSPVSPKPPLKPAAAAASHEPTSNPLDTTHSPLNSPLDPGPPIDTTPPALGSPPPPPPPPPADADVGWASYNPRAEFARQGVGIRTRAWRFTDINRDYVFSPTYPAKLVVPSRISDALLAYAAKYRSKARIPALSYLHWANHASITRSSQPMIGIKNTRSPQDERLVECIFTSHLSPDKAYSSVSPPPTSPSSSASVSTTTSPPVYGATPTNLIIDARPTANAMANKAKGAGTENMDWYKLAKKQHLGIDNIHVMRSSLKTVCEALAEADLTQTPVDYGKLRRSNWLKHTANILDGSLTIIRNIHIYSSHVLVHCSDGWDRTSQLCAIAQLCLDPYFRTLAGFKVLVEKDWLAFGHMFLQRSGHLSSDKLFTATPENLDADEESDDDFGVAVKGVQAFFGSVSKQFQSNSHLKEVSPVFHQFLDCVRQIQRQFPDRFEFNEDYLLDLHYHLYACQFGTFLFDSERQRRVAQSKSNTPYIDRTVSAWEWFDLPAQKARYLNPDFNSALDDRSSRAHNADLGVLLPDPKDVAFWSRLFKRSDEEMNPPQSRFLADAVMVPEEKTGTSMSDTASIASVSTINSVHPRAHAKEPSVSQPATPSASATVPAPLSRIAKPQSSGGGWNWSQISNGLSTGALSAFNQFKSTATDAISQLREGTDDEMWGTSSTSTTSSAAAAYAPGTGIGEGRQPSATLPRSSLRLPSESNPWSVEPPSAIMAAEKPSSSSATLPQKPNGSPSSSIHSASASHAALGANPWGDDSATRSRLGGLSLEDDLLKENSSGSGSGSRTNPKASAVAASTSADATRTRADEDKALHETAMGGDSKAWDPLGAL